VTSLTNKLSGSCMPATTTQGLLLWWSTFVIFYSWCHCGTSHARTHSHTHTHTHTHMYTQHTQVCMHTHTQTKSKIPLHCIWMIDRPICSLRISFTIEALTNAGQLSHIIQGKYSSCKLYCSLENHGSSTVSCLQQHYLLWIHCNNKWPLDLKFTMNKLASSTTIIIIIIIF